MKWSVVLQINVDIIISDALDQFVLIKLSNRLRINCWRLYKVSADVGRQYVVLNVYILNVFNAYINEIDMKESLNADWMSVRLKEEIKLVFTIKWIFIQNDV